MSAIQKSFASTRTLAVCALLLALLLLMSFTPIGFIGIGPIAVTIVHIPVLIGLLCEGLGVGLFLGTAFGVASLLRALTPTTLLAPFFLNPLVSVFPRILIPLLAWGTYRLLLRLLPSTLKTRSLIACAGSALVGTLTNTALVLFMLYLLEAPGIAASMQLSAEAVGGAMLTIALTNGIPEILFSTVLVPPIVLAIWRATHRIPL